MKNKFDKYLNEAGGIYQKGKTDIEGLWAAAKGFIETAKTQYDNDYIKGGSLLTLNNLQKNVLKDLISELKKIK
jgi:hypothetical protein